VHPDDAAEPPKSRPQPPPGNVAGNPNKASCTNHLTCCSSQVTDLKQGRRRYSCVNYGLCNKPRPIRYQAHSSGRSKEDSRLNVAKASIPKSCGIGTPPLNPYATNCLEVMSRRPQADLFILSSQRGVCIRESMAV
jgi:hypothetical protein